jgi:hypothetical protein
LSWLVAGNDRRMQIEDAGPMTADEQLGSPGWTFEKGWLVGVALGLVALVFLSRRRAHVRPAKIST